MRIASIADVKARLSTYLKESQEGPVIVTRNGKAVAVLLAVTDEDELEPPCARAFTEVSGASRQIPAPDRSDRGNSPRRFLA